MESLAWPAVGLVGIILSFVLINRLKPTIVKGEIAGQKFSLDGSQGASCIKVSRYLDARCQDADREISIDQKQMARLLRPIYLRILCDHSKGLTDEDANLQLAWRDFLDELIMIAEQNHILAHVKKGAISEIYFAKKMLEVEIAYRVGSARPDWFAIETGVRETLKKYIYRAADISRTRNFSFLQELEQMREAQGSKTSGGIIIAEEIQNRRELVK